VDSDSLRCNRTLISYGRAGEELECSYEAIRWRVRSGDLTKVVIKRRAYVILEEIEAIKRRAITLAQKAGAQVAGHNQPLQLLDRTVRSA
jgi:hypothetical protein